MAGMFKRSRRVTGTDYIMLNTRLCEACWKCYDNCPHDVFGMVNIIVHQHVYIENPQACTGCLKCVKLCRFGAIEPRENAGN
jgi:NAD-dependent dihydropyrimidine dehydrogenase PreA subunit